MAIAMDDAALESSLAAADRVICQTGCLSHSDYWRVQDHCKRTGKTCVLTDDACSINFSEAAYAASKDAWDELQIY